MTSSPEAVSATPWRQAVVLGSGRPVIVLPTAQGHASWLTPCFAPLAARWRVALPSHRGEREHGAVGDFGMPDLLADVEALARELAGDGPVALVGSSFGGAVALAFALEHPTRVGALVLHATTARMRNHRAAWRGGAWLAARSAPLATLGVHLFAAACCTPEMAVLGPTRAWRALRMMAAGRRRGHGTPADVILRRLKILFALDLESRLPELRCPTLVLSGGEGLDLLVRDVSQRALRQRIAGARAARLAGTGHLGPLTCPDAVRAVVEAFLADRWP